MRAVKIFVALVVVLSALSLKNHTVNHLNATEEFTKEEQSIHWRLMAFKPDMELLKIKAIDADGNMHDVKAIQISEDISVMDVKAFVNGKVLPVKLLVKQGDRYYPLKAIDEDGTIINVKAINEEGNIMDVKGVSKTGNVVHIRAITKYGEFYNVIAVSPAGQMADIKGLKMTQDTVEMEIKNNKVFAHVKCLGRF